VSITLGFMNRFGNFDQKRVINPNRLETKDLYKSLGNFFPNADESIRLKKNIS